MRMLDDVYGADFDRFPLEQEVLRSLSHLEWEEDDIDEGDPGEGLWMLPGSGARTLVASGRR